MTNIEFINVCEDSYRLFEYCKENGFTDCQDFEEWSEDCNDLAFFEGDPDMIKIDGETGYFCLCGDVCFFYMDAWDDSKVRGILRDFFAAGSMANCGYYSKFIPAVNFPESCQNWETWHSLKNGIAYRGGAGYFYNILPLAA